MTYFEKNIHAEDSLSDNLDRLMEAMSAVVSNVIFSLENEQTDKHEETFCCSIYTLIGICEAMLASFPDESREKSLSKSYEYFSGEYKRKREEAHYKAVSSLLERIFD